MVAPAPRPVPAAALVVAPPPFDAAALHPADRRFLSRAAAEVRVALGRAAREVIAAGRTLLRVRRRLGRGRFGGWLAAEGLPRTTAHRLMRVALAFGQLEAEAVARIDKTALYLLAEPSTPADVRAFAVEQAAGAGGEAPRRVTASEAGELIRVYREKGRDPTPAEVRVLAPDEKPPAGAAPDMAFALDNYRLVLDLLDAEGAVHLTAVRDADSGDLTVSGTLLPKGGPPRTAARGSAGDVLAALFGVAREKRCGRCPRGTGPKPLDEFSRCSDPGAKDGRNRYCKACERARVKRHEQKKKAAAPAPAPPAPAWGTRPPAAGTLF